MTNILIFSLVFIFGESLAFVLFKIMNFMLLKNWEFRFSVSVIKGMIERFFLFLALAYSLPHGLIAFGVIKIGTRIRPDEKITNDYFFIGNMISLTLAVIFFAFWKHFSGG